MADRILTADRRTRASQKSPAQVRLDDLVEVLVDHRPRHGYDECNLVITNEQAAIVIAADPDAANDIADACDNEALCRLLCASGEQAQNIALEIAAKTKKLAREGAQRALLQLVVAESERRQEEDDLLPRRAMNHACVVPYDEERRL
jgi:hypothetical protein